MATKNQLNQRLNSVLGLKLVAAGSEPPRLVRANSAFAKRVERGDKVVEV